MNLAGSRPAPGRGTDLLIAHCAVHDGHARPSIDDRLQGLLGPELKRLLLLALTAELHKPARV